MKLLVFGGTGQLGQALTSHAWPHSVAIVAPQRAECDLCDAKAVAETVAGGRFGAVINAAAYTAVDRAETEIATAWRVNALAPAILAEATGRRGIPLVQLSTDYVFDGTKGAPYVEDDPPRPLNVYGASKLAGEEAVRTGNPRHAIVRTAWLVSPRGSNFLRTILRLAGERNELRIVADQRGSPTGAADLAAALAAIVLRLAENAAAPTGTYHVTNAGEATWHVLASAIVAASASAGGPAAKVTAISTADYPTVAARPPDTRLDASKAAAAFGLAPRPWQEAVGEIVRTLAGRN